MRISGTAVPGNWVRLRRKPVSSLASDADFGKCVQDRTWIARDRDI
jgi:hypothetical protein